VRILLVTVGGSPRPIITSVKTLKADRIIFICSSGPKSSTPQVIGDGKPCKIIKRGKVVEELPNLVTVLNLGEKFDRNRDLFEVDPDDPSDSYRKISETIKQLISDNSTIMADYTGGTKTMSASLALAAMDYGIELYLTTGNRMDLEKVTGGESTEYISTALINLDRKLEQLLPVFMVNYNFSAAIGQLRELLQNLPLDPRSRASVRKKLNICLAFEAWDQFKHLRAWELLEGSLNDPKIRQLGLFLKRIITSHADIDEDFETSVRIKSHGFEIVEDLVMNAERRAVQGRYDDAVGRFYRALELLVQIHLFNRYNLKTGNLDLNKIPADYRSDYEKLRFTHNKNQIRLGLKQSYLLLDCFADDPLRHVYNENRGKIERVLNLRNQSLFAHGFRPISDGEYEEISNRTLGFIRASLEAICPADSKFEFLQFPSTLG